MKIYRIAGIYNDRVRNHGDYIGLHCQSRPRSEYDDIIINDNNYAEDYYLHILDALPFAMRDKASRLGLMQKPYKYTDEFDKWSEKVHEFLSENNIRWIFVSRDKALSDQYGDYRYHVLLPASCVLHIFDDPNVNDMAWAYLYNANECVPICIQLDDEEDGFENL
ncbi:MAG: hypothetical protein WC119_01890 [Synergistaceae bacterium]